MSRARNDCLRVHTQTDLPPDSFSAVCRLTVFTGSVMPRIINIADVEMQPFPPAFAPAGAAAERYAPRMGQIARQLGAQKLGYNVTAVPPGKRAFPAHNHQVNEEMFFILEGEGELHVGDAVHPVRPGDVVACTAGGPA